MSTFTRGLFALLITIFFQTEVFAEYLYKDEIIHNDKFTKDIEALGSELYTKTGIALKLVMLKELPVDTSVEVYEKKLMDEFSEPTVVLMFSEFDKNVNIWTNDLSLYKYFNKEQVLSPMASPVQAFFISILFARSVDDLKELMSDSGGTILPLLGNQVKGSQTGKYSAAMYNGYLDISMQIASSKDVDLDNGVGSSSQYPIMIVKTIFYGVLLYALFLYIRNKFKKKELKMSKGRIWPYAIGMAITFVFGFCVATIFVTESSKIQESDAFMTKYQEADLNANEFIMKKMNFDKLYNIEYVTKEISGDTPVISYKVTSKDGSLINNATIIVSISRPETEKFDKTLQNPKVVDGVYSFTVNAFPKAGVWNFISKVTVDGDERFFNIKADTRSSNSYEF